jgi:hypothetical protein
MLNVLKRTMVAGWRCSVFCENALKLRRKSKPLKQEELIGVMGGGGLDSGC